MPGHRPGPAVTASGGSPEHPDLYGASHQSIRHLRVQIGGSARRLQGGSATLCDQRRTTIIAATTVRRLGGFGLLRGDACRSLLAASAAILTLPRLPRYAALPGGGGCPA